MSTNKELTEFEKTLANYSSVIDAAANELVNWDNQVPPQVASVKFDHPCIKTMIDSITLDSTKPTAESIEQLVKTTSAALTTCVRSVLSGIHSDKLISALQDVVNAAVNEPDKMYLFLQINAACVTHIERVCTQIAEWVAAQALIKIRSTLLSTVKSVSNQPQNDRSTDSLFN